MKKIGVGMVGVGWMGQGLLRKLAGSPGVEIRAIVGRELDRCRPILEEFGIPLSAFQNDFTVILKDSGIDTVWLTNPNIYHGPMALAAMGAGKHVFCEKPAATTFAEFCSQIELQRANPQLVSFVDYILYFDPMERRLRQMVADGTFGTVTQIQVNYRNPLNIAGAKAWKLSREMMGDAFGMAINHALSVMVWAMASQARPVSVFATSDNARIKPFEAATSWTIQVVFDNGATGVCLGNIETGNGYDAYHNLFGTDGAFVFDPGQGRPQKIRYWSQRDTGGKWVWPLDAARCAADSVNELAWPVDTTLPDSGDIIHHQTAAAVEHFLECVRNGQQSPLSFIGAAPIGELGWAAQMSAALGKPIALPLDREAALNFFSRQG